MTDLANLDVGDMVSGIGNVTKNVFNAVGNVMNLKQFFAIKKGILYEYKSITARECESKYNIAKISAIDKNYQNEKQFQIMYKKFFITMECQDKWEVEKWINSLKLVKENPEEYQDDTQKDLFADDQAKQEKYVGMNVYQKVTGKSCFKDYDLLCEEYEQKTMLVIYLKSKQYVDEHKKNGTFADLTKQDAITRRSTIRQSEEQRQKQIQKEKEAQAAKEAEKAKQSSFSAFFNQAASKLNSATKITAELSSGKKDQSSAALDKEKMVRHEYMMSLGEFEQLLVKVNPAQIDLYKASCRQDGLKKELCSVVDEKAL